MPPTTSEVPVLVAEAVLPTQEVEQEVPVTSFDDVGEGFQVMRGRSWSEGGGTQSEATIVLTNNGFEVLEDLKGDTSVEAQPHVLGTSPHPLDV